LIQFSFASNLSTLFLPPPPMIFPH
jgi:hypothetical protein